MSKNWFFILVIVEDIEDMRIKKLGFAGVGRYFLEGFASKRMLTNLLDFSTHHPWNV